MAKLVLASASPRRQALLRAGGVDFEIRVSGINEDDHAHGTPRAIALKTSLAKASEVAETLEKNTIVLAADTMVIMEQKIFNKPADREDARHMLHTLSGRAHTVVTALTLLRAGAEAMVDAVYADVTFNPLSETLIEAYVASGEADDKAGAYGIQGKGAQFIGAVSGDLTCVIGLPLSRLREMYQDMTGQDLFAGKALSEVALTAFPDLTLLPPECLRGI